MVGRGKKTTAPEMPCPKCGKVGFFGWRKRNGYMSRQSWCSKCRNKPPCDSYTHTQHEDPPGLPTSKEEVKVMYLLNYPNDKAGPKRSYNFMVSRLCRKLKLPS